MKSRNWLILAVLCASLLVLLPARAQEGYEFMPKGGKALLIQRLGDPADTAELRRIAVAQRSEAEWNDVLAARKGAMSDRELQTLASYLAVNMPMSEGALELAEQQGAVTAALPPDGRELAWNHCQFCHSLFTGYLTHDRDVQGWLGTFETPAHREIEMSATERETFARYSTINMPMRIQDVPEELRF
jgi:hypothetical protein